MMAMTTMMGAAATTTIYAYPNQIKISFFWLLEKGCTVRCHGSVLQLNLWPFDREEQIQNLSSWNIKSCSKPKECEKKTIESKVDDNNIDNYHHQPQYQSTENVELSVKINRFFCFDCFEISNNELLTHSHELNLCGETTAIDWNCKRFISIG